MFLYFEGRSTLSGSWLVGYAPPPVSRHMYVLLNAPLGFNHSIRCLIFVLFVSTVKYEYIHGTKYCTYILFSNVYIFYQYISTLQCTPLYVVSIAFQRKGSVIGWCQCLGELARCSLGTKAIPRRWQFSTVKSQTKSKSKYLWFNRVTFLFSVYAIVQF